MLTVEDLRAAHDGLDVVHGVTVSITPGSVVSLLGPNGAGKSTVARCIAGLLRVRRGRIEVDGQDITDMAAHRRIDHGVSMVPEARCLFPELTVRDNLLLGTFRRNRSGREEALAQVGETFPRLTERLRQQAGSLSGGEQQMLAIGRALMCRPGYLVLDEPSLGLAPIIVSTIMAKIRGLADAGVGVLLVEQNATRALEISDTAIVMERGAVVMRGPADQLRSDARIGSSYLGRAV